MCKGEGQRGEAWAGSASRVPARPGSEAVRVRRRSEVPGGRPRTPLPSPLQLPQAPCPLGPLSEGAGSLLRGPGTPASARLELCGQAAAGHGPSCRRRSTWTGAARWRRRAAAPPRAASGRPRLRWERGGSGGSWGLPSERPESASSEKYFCTAYGYRPR